MLRSRGSWSAYPLTQRLEVSEVPTRPRLPEDDGEWARLRHALWPTLALEAHRVDMQAWLNRADAVVMVAPRSAGGLCGFAEAGARSIADGCNTSPVAYLEGWFVDPDSRKRGIGAALIRAVEHWARTRGHRELASDAELENLQGQRAHLAVGFAEVGRVVLYLKAL